MRLAKQEFDMSKYHLALLVAVSGTVLGACGGSPETGSLSDVPGIQVDDLAGNKTLLYVPPGTQVAPEHAPSAASTAKRTLSVFYPKPGEGGDGLCWTGLTNDAEGNLYPIANAGFSKLDSNANIINGEDDTNFFATDNESQWGVIDEPAHKIFAASLATIRSAKFRANATFTELAGGLKTQGEGIALGKGQFTGSLFATDAGASRVYHVTLSPTVVQVFASGSLFKVPEAIASGPDGTVYVVNVGSISDPMGRSVIKIAPSGKASVFATAKDTAARRMLAVDNEGTVFWSSATGIDRFKPDGTRLSPLPGPTDQAGFVNPMGSAFDSQENLYVIENDGCKKIYKYTEH
jgi:hypothetical protein